MADLAAHVRSMLESWLDDDERLEGVCMASQQSTFRGRSVALGVTEGRLLIQHLDRRGNAHGHPLSLTPERIAEVKAGGAGGGWVSVGNVILDQTAARLELKTTDGQKLRLMMMHGGGGLMGKLGGGEAQSEGLTALGEWFRRNDPAS
jgi:hypothetical protein